MRLARLGTLLFIVVIGPSGWSHAQSLASETKNLGAVQGIWSFTIQAGARTYEPTLRLEALPSGALKGVYRSDDREASVSGIEWDGRNLRFQAAVSVEGRDLDLDYVGTIERDQFTGEVVYEAGDLSGSLPVTGRRRSLETRPTSNAPAVSGPLPAPEQTDKTSGCQVVTFQQGVNGYEGAEDVELWGVAPTKALGEQGTMTSDADNGGGESHVLVKFTQIFRDDAGARSEASIPRGARIARATLTVIAFDPGTTVFLHPMLVPWDESATWNSMATGISANDVEAARRWDGFTFGQINMDKQSVEFDVTTTVQGWADGQSNQGWVFLNSGGNGWDFYSSEWHEVDLRPKLRVEWALPASPSPTRSAPPTLSTPSDSKPSR
jgi:hypothetical protein